MELLITFFITGVVVFTVYFGINKSRGRQQDTQPSTRTNSRWYVRRVIIALAAVVCVVAMICNLPRKYSAPRAIAKRIQRVGTRSGPTVYRFSNLYSFNLVDGPAPRFPLTEGNDGYYYGTTTYGGQDGDGTIFRISSVGEMALLHSFNGDDGGYPNNLLEGDNGNFYGSTSAGGLHGFGTIFVITPSGDLTTLYAFTGRETDGANGPSELIWGNDGNFYGTTFGPSPIVFRATTSGKFTTIHQFGAGDLFVSLVQGSDGNLYGSTAANDYDETKGTIFKFNQAGVLTNLHVFRHFDGSEPGKLVQGSDGSLYGSTAYGGTFDCGTIFRITSNGTMTTLHMFQGDDGKQPRNLVEGAGGNFYGCTNYGGNGHGTLFRITSAGRVTTLHLFSGKDGTGIAELTGSSDGNLYGVSYNGGTDGYPDLYGTYERKSSTLGGPGGGNGTGYGTVFKLTCTY